MMSRLWLKQCLQQSCKMMLCPADTYKKHLPNGKCFLFSDREGAQPLRVLIARPLWARLRYRSSPFLLKTIINRFLNAKTPTVFEPLDLKRKIKNTYLMVSVFYFPTEKGLEPSTSSVTGWHSNQLNYSAIFPTFMYSIIGYRYCQEKNRGFRHFFLLLAASTAGGS